MARLTEKSFWEETWENLPLPAPFLADYSHQIILRKFLYIIKKNKSNIGKFIEIGGCPGRWADFFTRNFRATCDMIEYGKNNCRIAQKNYQLLGISGKIFNQDIFHNTLKKNSYDIVLSDGLVEHFDEMLPIFRKHAELVKKGGLLVIGVPNIKQSRFYDFFAKKDKASYKGYRAVEKNELISAAKKLQLKILFCDYLGVVNPGLVHWGFIKNTLLQKIVNLSIYLLNFAIAALRITKESPTFSPYIYLIAKK